MIFVYWQPGCYGSYVMHRVYAYSSLGYNSNSIFKLESTGSSHEFRDSSERARYFEHGHSIELGFEKYLIINPSKNHYLDYFNNQLVKQEKGDVVHSFKSSFPSAWYENFLPNWKTPEIWALREWASFWLTDNFANSYKLNKKALLETADLFNTNHNIFVDVINHLGLTTLASDAIMKADQLNWIKMQKFHNSQNRCDQYVLNVINDEYADSPCQTILDEAYVQLLLRKNGYEIQCDGLDVFPKNSFALKEIMYETSHTNC